MLLLTTTASCLPTVSSDYQPVIQDDFIKVSPRNPKRGQTIQLECFAYGTWVSLQVWSSSSSVVLEAESLTHGYLRISFHLNLYPATMTLQFLDTHNRQKTDQPPKKTDFKTTNIVTDCARNNCYWVDLTKTASAVTLVSPGLPSIETT